MPGQMGPLPPPPTGPNGLPGMPLPPGAGVVKKQTVLYRIIRLMSHNYESS